MISSTDYTTGVVAAQGLSPTPQSDVPWLTATSDVSAGALTYNAAPAPVGTARTGHITVGATTLTVVQPASIFDGGTGWWCDPPPPVCNPEFQDCSYEIDYEESCIGGDGASPLRPAHVRIMTADVDTNQIRVWLRGDAQGRLVIRLDGPEVSAVVIGSRWVARGYQNFDFGSYLADVRAGLYPRITADWEITSWGPNVSNCDPAPEPGGDPCDEKALPPPTPQESFGIFAKSQTVPLTGEREHIAIKIIPQNQALWSGLSGSPLYAIYFKNKDVFGHWFATLGAGPGQDVDIVPSQCLGQLPLVSGANRGEDVKAPPAHFELLNYDKRVEAEDVLISRLFALALEGYQNNLTYYCLPEGLPGYNSNSFAAGLLNAAGIPPPSFPSALRTPGWEKPVPVNQFFPR
jgi:hypothetical protein